MQLELGTPEAIDRAQAISEELMTRVRYLSMDLRVAGVGRSGVGARGA